MEPHRLWLSAGTAVSLLFRQARPVTGSSKFPVSVPTVWICLHAVPREPPGALCHRLLPDRFC